eukprot:CAMPEP_0175102984 /NCGR_PEP_ID=MMETSP0086_2-20121207/8787_1 /TAXON_ID=136419 /ORGANISM="Unknown Unknown, Strain D1" /LENGTH=176 /DNA_ID=CAMNT_0016377949 /DNA_START=395 /DNA_END=924 /DNA_ORIENTATION=-
MNPSVAVDNRVVEAVGGDSQAVREGRAAEGTTWTAEVGSLVARGNLGSLGADDSQPVAEGTPSAVHDLCEFAGLELEELGEQTCSCHPTCNSPVGRNGTEGLCLSCVAGWCPATAAAFQRGEQNGEWENLDILFKAEKPAENTKRLRRDGLIRKTTSKACSMPLSENWLLSKAGKE